MPAIITTTIDRRVLDGILKNLDGNIEKAVAVLAFGVEGRAKINAPVDTGALRASIYTSVRRGGSHPRSFSGVTYEQLPMPANNTTAYVGPSVEYGAAVELGTTRRAATPYLIPAVRQTEREAAAVYGKAVNNGK